MARPVATCLLLLLVAAASAQDVPPSATAPAPAPLADQAAPAPGAAPPSAGAPLATPGLPSKAELAGLVLGLANIQSLGASKLGVDLDVTCTPGTLTPSRRAPAVLQWPSARTVVVTAACVKNGTGGAGYDGDAPPCEGALTSSVSLPAYALPPRWEPASFQTPACRAGVTLPFPGALAGGPPGGDGGLEINLLPANTLECDSIASLKNLAPGAWLGGRGRDRKSRGCAVSGPLVDPEAALAAALAKLEEAKGVLGLA